MPSKSGKGEEVDVLAVGDRMGKRGWHLNGLSQPKAVHIACTVSLRFGFLRSLRMLSLVATVTACERGWW